MRTSASILIPTRKRRDYLAHTLASVAPQAAEHSAEIVIVEDGTPDPENERAAEEHGARYLALAAPQGINAARNAALDAAQADLLCFLDDDVEVWPGWLGALLGAADALPEYEVFGGPIRPRLEGNNLHACGREPPVVTQLDLGAEDTDADFVWGANMALRRGALERIGPFDPVLGGAGDEEDWQRRLRAADGRIRYVAGAGVDHRRAGPDARIRALSRAALHRGRYARRYDARKGTAPGLAGELRTLLGCVWHTFRYRCGNGIVLTALTLGRLREALRPTDQALRTTDPDFLSGRSGTLGRRAMLVARLRDRRADVAAARGRRRLRRAARGTPARRVLVLCVARPEHAKAVAAVGRELGSSIHDVLLRVVPAAAGAGKWANLNDALAAHPARGFHWLLILDDDVELPKGFLDVFVHLAEQHGFRLAQPAHAFASHAGWEVTRRRPGLTARRTRFVEIGPATAIRADAFGALLPFPDLQMGWGLDAHWSAVAAERGWQIGIVDATPIRHTRPVATRYPRDEAIAEARRFLSGRSYVTREQAGEVVEEYRDWPQYRRLSRSS